MPGIAHTLIFMIYYAGRHDSLTIPHAKARPSNWAQLTPHNRSMTALASAAAAISDAWRASHIKAGSTARQPLLPVAPTHRWQKQALMGAFGIHPPDEAFEEFSHLYIKDAVDRQHPVRPQNRQKGEVHYLEVAKRSAGVFNHEEAQLPCFAASHLLSSTWTKQKYRQ
jgi:hypothetical protein